MLMHEAMRIINDEPKPMGYMVSFERKEGRFLAGDHFPDKHRGEPLIQTEEEAWVLAPKQPTTDMLYAMAECDGYQRGDRDHPMLTRWEDYWHMALSALTHNAKVTGSPDLSASPRGLPG